jgi:iron complex transport system substrate-binding protein
VRFPNRPTPSSSDKEDVFLRRIPFLALAMAAVISACAGTAATSNTTFATTSGPATTATLTTATLTTATEVTGFPVTVETATGPVRIPAQPESIISLSATATEILFAIGAGDQVVAVDEFSDFPAEAPTTDLSGFTPNVEAIASYVPDLVIVSFDPEGLVASLASLDIPVIQHGAAVTIDDTYTQIEQLGAATGRVAEAADLVADMRAAIDELVAGLPPSAQGLTYYHELDDTLFSVTSTTFIGQLYSLLGLTNIADGSDPDGFGYPQLSAEVIVEADPDFIFLADTVCCGQNQSTVAARPGWQNLQAVVNGRVIELDDAVASRWGPRVVEFLETVSAAVAGVPVG